MVNKLVTRAGGSRGVIGR